MTRREIGIFHESHNLLKMLYEPFHHDYKASEDELGTILNIRLYYEYPTTVGPRFIIKRDSVLERSSGRSRMMRSRVLQVLSQRITRGKFRHLLATRKPSALPAT